MKDKWKVDPVIWEKIREAEAVERAEEDLIDALKMYDSAASFLVTQEASHKMAKLGAARLHELLRLRKTGEIT